MEEKAIHDILRAGALLQGQTITEHMALIGADPDPTLPDEARTVTFLQPWTLELHEGTVDLGYVAFAFSGSLHQRDQEFDGARYDIWSVDDGKVVLRWASEEEQKALLGLPVSTADS